MFQNHLGSPTGEKDRPILQCIKIVLPLAMTYANHNGKIEDDIACILT